MVLSLARVFTPSILKETSATSPAPISYPFNCALAFVHDPSTRKRQTVCDEPRKTTHALMRNPDVCGWGSLHQPTVVYNFKVTGFIISRMV